MKQSWYRSSCECCQGWIQRRICYYRFWRQGWPSHWKRWCSCSETSWSFSFGWISLVRSAQMARLTWQAGRQVGRGERPEWIEKRRSLWGVLKPVAVGGACAELPLAAGLSERAGQGCNFTLLWHIVQSLKTITWPSYRLLCVLLEESWTVVGGLWSHDKSLF